jgi:tetratricopeptide (TPR) repeat protein
LTLHPRIAPALLIAAALAAYANALPAAFQFDDYNVIVDQPAVHGLGAWLDSMPGIRPLLKLSYALNWIAGGAAGFHAVNVLVHAVNALLVYAIGLELLRAAPRGRAVPPEALALFAALVFALHPAQTEAVSYVSGRSVSLMAAFYLGAVLGWLRGRTMLSALLFALALAVKENAWTLPFALLLLARLREAPWRSALRSLAAHAAVLAAFAAAVLAVPGYRRLVFSSLGTRTLGENIVGQIEGVWYLLGTPLLMLRVNIDPDLSVPAAWTPALAMKAALLVGLLVYGALALRRSPWIGVALLWCFLHLAPTNSILPRADLANDRALYLALLGPAALLAAAFARLPAPRAALAAACALALVLGARTAARNLEYRDEVSLWTATVAASPGKARAWNNLGHALELAGEPEAARHAYLRALDLDPSHLRARGNLLRLGDK